MSFLMGIERPRQGENGLEVTVDATRFRSMSPLSRMVMLNDLDGLRKKIRATWPSSGFDERDNKGWTALHWASYLGLEECAKILLENGADPNVYTRAGGHQIPNAAGTIGVTGSSFWRRPNMPTPADVVDMLVNSGVNLFTSDRDGTRRLILDETTIDMIIEPLIDLAREWKQQSTERSTVNVPPNTANDLEQEISSQWDRLCSSFNTPKSLKDLCRISVRRELRGQQLSGAIDKLPVPRKLKDYLVFKSDHPRLVIIKRQ